MVSARLAQNYMFQGNYDKTYFYFCLGKEQIIKDPSISLSFQTLLYQIQSIAYFDQGLYDKALETMDEGIRISHKRIMNFDNGDTFGIPFLLHRNNILVKQHYYKEALQSVNNIEKRIRSYYGDNSVFLIKTSFVKAECLLNLGKIKEAEKEIYKAVNIKKSDDRALAAGLKIKGDVLYKKNKLEEALRSYFKAKSLYSKLYKDKNINYISELYTQIIKILIDKNHRKEAIKLKNEHENNHRDRIKIEFYYKQKF